MPRRSNNVASSIAGTAHCVAIVKWKSIHSGARQRARGRERKTFTHDQSNISLSAGARRRKNDYQPSTILRRQEDLVRVFPENFPSDIISVSSPIIEASSFTLKRHSVSFDSTSRVLQVPGIRFFKFNSLTRHGRNFEGAKSRSSSSFDVKE